MCHMYTRSVMIFAVLSAASVAVALPATALKTSFFNAKISVSAPAKADITLKKLSSGKKIRITDTSFTVLKEGKYSLKAKPISYQNITYNPTLVSPSLKDLRASDVLLVKFSSSSKKLVFKIKYVEQTSNTTAPPPPTDVPTNAALLELHNLVNEARSEPRKCGDKSMPAVAPLKYDQYLGQAAQTHAEDMAVNKYFSHDSLDGSSFVDRINRTPFTGDPGGENIASGQQSASAALSGWLNSPGHCVNLMDPDFDVVGYGYSEYKDPKYSTPVTYWVQDFGYSY